MENGLDLSFFSGHELSLDEVRAMPRGKGVHGWVDGMFICAGDDPIAVRFLNGHGYESVTRELWRRCCKRARLVADIGTHSGVFSLDAYRAGARLVVSVEPHPINFSRMVMNLRHNGFPTFGAYFGAAGDVSEITMFKAVTLHMVHAAGQIQSDGNGEHIPVRVVRLDDLIGKEAWSHLNVVKIDAENFTQKVLEGMGRIFSEGHRPDLILECTSQGMGELLKPLGYRFWMIRESGKVEEVEDLLPHNPENNYNGTQEDCRNRFASVNGLPKEEHGPR